MTTSSRWPLDHIAEGRADRRRILHRQHGAAGPHPRGGHGRGPGAPAANQWRRRMSPCTGGRGAVRLGDVVRPMTDPPAPVHQTGPGTGSIRSPRVRTTRGPRIDPPGLRLMPSRSARPSGCCCPSSATRSTIECSSSRVEPRHRFCVGPVRLCGSSAYGKTRSGDRHHHRCPPGRRGQLQAAVTPTAYPAGDCAAERGVLRRWGCGGLFAGERWRRRTAQGTGGRTPRRARRISLLCRWSVPPALAIVAVLLVRYVIERWPGRAADGLRVREQMGQLSKCVVRPR